MSMIRVEKLSKAFGSLQVLKDVDLTVEKGERIVIIGGSGCGKSVFLRCMDFLEIPDEGAVFLGDDELTTNQKDLNRIRRKVGMVFQGFHLFSHMTVLDNITLAPIKLLGLSPCHHCQALSPEKGSSLSFHTGYSAAFRTPHQSDDYYKK